MGADPFARGGGGAGDKFVTLFQCALPEAVRERLVGLPGVVAVPEQEVMTGRLQVAPPRDQDAGLYRVKAMAWQGTGRSWPVLQAVARMMGWAIIPRALLPGVGKGSEFQ